jgi:hypothetical protein
MHLCDLRESARGKPKHKIWNPAATPQSRRLVFTERQDGILQRPDAGEPQRCGSGIEPAKLSGQRGNTLAVAACLSRRPGKSWWPLDKDAKGNGLAADGDRGGHRICRRVDYRYVIGRGVAV